MGVFCINVPPIHRLEFRDFAVFPRVPTSRLPRLTADGEGVDVGVGGGEVWSVELDVVWWFPFRVAWLYRMDAVAVLRLVVPD